MQLARGWNLIQSAAICWQFSRWEALACWNCVQILRFDLFQLELSPQCPCCKCRSSLDPSHCLAINRIRSTLGHLSNLGVTGCIQISWHSSRGILLRQNPYLARTAQSIGWLRSTAYSQRYLKLLARGTTLLQQKTLVERRTSHMDSMLWVVFPCCYSWGLQFVCWTPWLMVWRSHEA